MQHGQFTPELIAPCGMNCGICIAFFGYTMNGKRRKHACITCRLSESPCAFIKTPCDKLTDRKIACCFECMEFPCNNLEKRDRCYQDKYGMSVIANLKDIRTQGIEHFLKTEHERWKCATCGGIICVHNQTCYSCN